MAATKREKRRRETSPEPLQLPPDIIREILIRLPAKTIGRFRCVSKLFRSLSSDPGFAKRHLDLTLHRKLIVSAHNLYALGLDGIGDAFDGITDLVAVELNYPLKEIPSKYSEMIRRTYCGSVEIIRRSAVLHPRNRVQIIGSSNGLMCISPADDDGDLFLYNPTTGDSKRLLPDLLVGGGEEGFEAHGFGYDDLTDDYKVVKLVADNQRVVVASVYSLKADSWKRIRDLNYKNDVVAVNKSSAIHWVFTFEEATTSTTTKKSVLVLAFDVKTDTFRAMPLPGGAVDCSHHDYRGFYVGDLNGRLCVINRCDGDHNDIWVMEEYGVASSWTRIRIELLFMHMRPLCSTENSDDEAILELDGEMVVYNFEADAWRFLQIRGANLRGGFETHTYLESLVSPSSYGVAN